MHDTYAKARARIVAPPEWLDPSGVPCTEASEREAGGGPRSGTRPALPGMDQDAVVVLVEAVASRGEDEWLLWGCLDGRQTLLGVEPRRAAEIAAAIELGEPATLILDPHQVLLQAID